MQPGQCWAHVVHRCKVKVIHARSLVFRSLGNDSSHKGVLPGWQWHGACPTRRCDRGQHAKADAAAAAATTGRRWILVALALPQATGGAGPDPAAALGDGSLLPMGRRWPTPWPRPNPLCPPRAPPLRRSPHSAGVACPSACRPPDQGQASSSGQQHEGATAVPLGSSGCRKRLNDDGWYPSPASHPPGGGQSLSRGRQGVGGVVGGGGGLAALCAAALSASGCVVPTTAGSGGASPPVRVGRHGHGGRGAARRAPVRRARHGRGGTERCYR